MAANVSKQSVDAAVELTLIHRLYDFLPVLLLDRIQAVDQHNSGFITKVKQDVHTGRHVCCVPLVVHVL